MSESAPSASVVTIGTELVVGETANTNATWLCHELTKLGLTVLWAATVPDDVGVIAESVRVSRAASDAVLVSGGLGGTPDDVTREGIARAFGVEVKTDRMLALAFRSAHDHTQAFADIWSRLPVGATPIFGMPGGAPGFKLENVYVLPGMPAEMRDMFGKVVPDLGRGPVLHTWSRTLPTSEHRVLRCLEELSLFHRSVQCGSYPRFGSKGPEVEIVLRAADRKGLAAASRVVDRFARSLQHI